MSLLDTFPTENVTLHKPNGVLIGNVKALVDGNIFHIDNTSLEIEKGDYFVRSLPNGSKAYYLVKDRSFFKGNVSSLDHYEVTVEESNQNFEKRVLEVNSMDSKQHKLLISHSSADEKYVEALVELLESIKMSEESIVCTSVPGYGVPGGQDIYDWLRDQFTTCNLRVLFVLSKNYYDSIASLNEMGAAWLAKSSETLLLLPNFKFKDIKGCINGRKVGIGFEEPDKEIKHRLTELKDTLVKEFQLPQQSSSIWERHRDAFIEKIKSIAESATESTSENISNAKNNQSNIKKDTDDISLDSAFLLVYAANDEGRILKISSLSAPTLIATSSVHFSADNSRRESARWQEALENLLALGMVKPVGQKGEVFELTGTGYIKADQLKERLKIDTNRDMFAQLQELSASV